jgi:hypothetical protein
VIAVEVREEDAARRAVLRDPLAEGLLHGHLLGVHHAREEAADGCLVGRVPERSLDAGVDEEGPERGVVDDVEEHLDGLVVVREVRLLRARVVEVDEAAARHGPLGRDHGLHLEGPWLIHHRQHLGRAARLAQHGRLRRVGARGAAGGAADGDEAERGDEDRSSVRVSHGDSP